MALTQWVFQLYAFLENTYHERLFANQQNAIANFEPFECIELLIVPGHVFYKHCYNSFTNKPAFLSLKT